MQKDALLLQIAGHDPFFMTYRILQDGKPAYYCMKAIRANTHDDHHIVIGISNIDVQVSQVLADAAVSDAEVEPGTA